MSIAAHSYFFTDKKTHLVATWVPNPTDTVPDGFTMYDWPLDVVGLEYNKEYKFACLIPKNEFYLTFECGGLVYSNCLIETDSTTKYTAFTIRVDSQTSGAINAIFVNGKDILFEGLGGEAETASPSWRIIGTVDAPPSVEDIIHTQIKITSQS